MTSEKSGVRRGFRTALKSPSYKGGFMNTRLPLFKIEAILHTYLRPFQCECRDDSDNSLRVRLFQEPPNEELTVLGISYDQCRDAANLVRLAQELRIEMCVTRSSLPAEGKQLSQVE
jgi:hypothetical protein